MGCYMEEIVRPWIIFGERESTVDISDGDNLSLFCDIPKKEAKKIIHEHDKINECMNYLYYRLIKSLNQKEWYEVVSEIEKIMKGE